MNSEPTLYRDPTPRPAIGYMPAEARGGITDQLQRVGSYISTYDILRDTPRRGLKDQGS